MIAKLGNEHCGVFVIFLDNPVFISDSAGPVASNQGKRGEKPTGSPQKRKKELSKIA